MRLLADMGLSATTMAAFRQHGHDAVHVAKLGHARATDEFILGLARVEGRVLVTCDLDFGDLLVMQAAHLPSVVLVRLTDQAPVSLTPRVLAVLDRHADALVAGALIVVEDRRDRVRRLPIQR